jgi:hypothetical protein
MFVFGIPYLKISLMEVFSPHTLILKKTP